MKYFLIETDEGNRCPYSINKNHAIDVRNLTGQNMDKLSLWNVVEMDFPDEGFFPDLICSPWLLVSESFIKTIKMYQSETLDVGMKLWDKKSGINKTYFFPLLREVECLSDKCEYNSVRNRIIKLVLDRGKVGDLAVFRIKGYERKCLVGRMDFVESILRRNIAGVKLTEVAVDTKS